MNNYTIYEVTIKNTNQDLLELMTVVNNVNDLNKLLLALADAPNYQLIKVEKVEGNFTPFEKIIETLVEDSKPKDLNTGKIVFRQNLPPVKNKLEPPKMKPPKKNSENNGGK